MCFVQTHSHCLQIFTYNLLFKVSSDSAPWAPNQTVSLGLCRAQRKSADFKQKIWPSKFKSFHDSDHEIIPFQLYHILNLPLHISTQICVAFSSGSKHEARLMAIAGLAQEVLQESRIREWLGGTEDSHTNPNWGIQKPNRKYIK